MMMSNLAPWDKLKPYDTDQKKSFELLCYQIAFEEFQSKGVLTPVDDSGGGDGVEFFITMPNGDVWGWQAKFFSRLDEGGRKSQIQKSLQTAYKKHPQLKKWFLCNKNDFTPAEKVWYEEKLASSIHNSESVLPENADVCLEHWGESELLRFLAKYPGINNYFFQEKLFTWNWFEEKYQLAYKSNQTKVRS
jgi:hypothetical protein